MERTGELPVAVELVRRIGWLIRLRWLAVAGVVCAVEIAGHVLRLPLPMGYLYAAMAGLALHNAAFFFYARRRRPTEAGMDMSRASFFARFIVPRTFWGLGLNGTVYQAAKFAFFQLTVDLIFLATLIHLSGGIENPFLYFFVFHVIIASILLSRRATYAQATIGLVLVCLVALSEGSGWLEHYTLAAMGAPSVYHDIAPVVVRLLVLGATLFLSAYMCSNIAVHLRLQERDMLLLSEDCTRKAQALEVAYDNLRQSEKAKAQYMRKVAHELRGPLGTIETALKVVLQGLVGEIPEKSRDLIARAQRRAGDLASVTQDLLVLSRARESPILVSVATVHPSEIAREVVAESEEAARQAGVTVTLKIAEEPGPMEADPLEIRQLIGNLVGNAIRYTPGGGKVTVCVGREDHSTRLEVSDTGIGIPQEDLARIFDEFFRAANAREHESSGSGLGLAIVKAIAARYGGSISVESVVGEGSRFVAILPGSLARAPGRPGPAEHRSGDDR